MYNEDRQVYSKMLRDTNYFMDSFNIGSNYTLIQKLEYSNCITCTTIQIITYNT